MTRVRETRHRAGFDLGGFFEPYVRQWLIDTDNKTTQWVQAVRSYNLLHSGNTDASATRRSQQTRLVSYPGDT